MPKSTPIQVRLSLAQLMSSPTCGLLESFFLLLLLGKQPLDPNQQLEPIYNQQHFFFSNQDIYLKIYHNSILTHPLFLYTNMA